MATHRITVDGSRVGYTYRDRLIRGEDSGWRFFAGDEDERYMAGLQRHGAYDVNAIVNHDPDILPGLDAGIGSCFERDAAGAFRKLEDNG
jgi:hypothetical protein